MLVVQVLLCANSSGPVHANTFRKKLKWKAPWSTAASPYAGKWVSSRDSWLCQVWQKWPVFSLWLLLMLNYINYECGSQRAWGGSSISVSLLKAVPLIIHHRPCSTEPQIPSHVWGAHWLCVCLCVYAGMHPPGPPLARPILPKDRGAMDRVIEYLVGDGPQNRWTLYHDLYLYTEQNQGVTWFPKEKDHHIIQRRSAWVQPIPENNKCQFGCINILNKNVYILYIREP